MANNKVALRILYVFWGSSVFLFFCLFVFNSEFGVELLVVRYEH